MQNYEKIAERNNGLSILAVAENLEVETKESIAKKRNYLSEKIFTVLSSLQIVYVSVSVWHGDLAVFYNQFLFLNKY